MPTTPWNGLNFTHTNLGDGRWSVRLTPESEVEQVDDAGEYVAPQWPDTDVVSSWVGEPVRFLDRGDGGGFESIYQIVDPVLVRVDDENHAEAWWDALRNAFPALAASLARPGVEEVVSTATLARLRALPGWEGGPEYAPHPLVVEQA